MPQLSRGQKVRLADLTSSQTLRIALATAPGLRFDFCCFGLDESGKLADERNFIFYNQKSSPNRAIEIVGERAGEAMTFAVDLSRLPANVRRVVFTLVVDGSGTMSDLKSGQWSVLVAGAEVARFNFAGKDFGAEKSLIVGEIYFHGEQWRIAAVGQGFREGLDALLRHYGGEVAPEAATPQTRAGAVAARPANEPRPLRPSTAPLDSAPNTPRATAATARSAPAAPSVPQEGQCVRCGKIESLWGKLGLASGVNKTTRHCRECEVQIKVAFERLRADFGRAWHSGILNNALWDAMWKQFDSTRTGATRASALEWLRPDAIRAVERLVVMAASDGEITQQEDDYVRQICAALALPAGAQAPFLARLESVKQTAKIRQGHLPRVAAGDFHLDSDELCHLNVSTTYHKVNARSTTLIDGRLLATSKKLIFLASSGGRTIQFKNVMVVRASGNAIALELSTQSGNGRYSVANAEHCEAVITALTRMAKRQLLSPQSDSPTRHIAQDIKNAVWQRDGGRCVQCTAETYLEFDHIIPFSKGGANTLNNVQLLCRKCNSEKGDKI